MTKQEAGEYTYAIGMAWRQVLAKVSTPTWMREVEITVAFRMDSAGNLCPTWRTRLAAWVLGVKR